MAVHLESDPTSFAPRLRTLATAVDPNLRLDDVQPLDQLARGFLTAAAFIFRILVVAGSIALLLSLAGVYSVMSFTVSRRTQEIGIRVALGSDRRRILAALFSRALFQVGLGVLVGVALVVSLASNNAENADWLSAKGAGLITAYAALMMAVCTLACVVPARRALRVQPIAALRADST